MRPGARAPARNGGSSPAKPHAPHPHSTAHRHPLPGADFDSKRVHKETLSPLDTTTYAGAALPGEHPHLADDGARGAPRPTWKIWSMFIRG